MICIVLPVMERVQKGQETREVRLFFPVGTDLPARRRPAALDLPVSPVSVIGPALAGNSLESTPSVPAPQPISATICGACVLCRFTLRSACVLTRHSTVPRVHGGGYCHPAAADAAASALRALRRAAPATCQGVPPSLRVLPDVPCLSAAHTASASCVVGCVPALQSSLLSLWLLSESYVNRGRALRVPDTR